MKREQQKFREMKGAHRQNSTMGAMCIKIVLVWLDHCTAVWIRFSIFDPLIIRLVNYDEDTLNLLGLTFPCSIIEVNLFVFEIVIAHFDCCYSIEYSKDTQGHFKRTQISIPSIDLQQLTVSLNSTFCGVRSSSANAIPMQLITMYNSCGCCSWNNYSDFMEKFYIYTSV